VRHRNQLGGERIVVGLDQAVGFLHQRSVSWHPSRISNERYLQEMLDREAGPLRYLPFSRFAAFFSAMVFDGFFLVSFFLS